MDCVYTAYYDYMKYLGVDVTDLDYQLYHLLKVWTHGPAPQYTFGGAVPWMLTIMAATHGACVSGVEYRIYTPAHLRQVVQEQYVPYIPRLFQCLRYLNAKGREVERIKYTRAIYLLLTGQHAVFSKYIPDSGTPVMAIHIASI